MKPYTPDAKVFQDAWKLPDNPFPFLGADQYHEEQVLSLFEIDRDSTLRAFSLQNSIIEGSLGTGKTMLLKAIYAFHYSKMIIDLAERKQAVVVPVYLKFSDISYGTTDLYKELILLIYRRILDTRFLVNDFLRDSTWFDKFGIWLKRLTKSGLFNEDKRYSELSAQTVTTRVSEIFKAEGSVGFDWLQKLAVEYENKFEKEISLKPNPTFTDIEGLFQRAFQPISERLLLLIDEVDTLPTDAFTKQENQKYSVYETLFNQLRTSKHLLYKIAVYPGTESSNQVEGSRIGTRVKLGFDIKDPDDFSAARDFFYRILRSYLSFCAQREIEPANFFKIQFSQESDKYATRIKRVDEQHYGDALEQLVFGSKGTVRRFIKLAGDSMLEAVSKERAHIQVGKFDVFDAMRSFGKELIERLQENERALIDRIAYYGIQHRAFRFRIPGHEDRLLNIYNRDKQDNVIYPILDEARKGLTYIFEFDYCYCLYRNVPTHVFLNAEKSNSERSLVNGKWIVQPANVPQEIINLEAKLEGEIKVYLEEEQYGFIKYLDNKDLFFHRVNVLSLGEHDMKQGVKVNFRIGRNYKGECAVDIEVL